jgi:hypothetical protein
MNMNFSSGFIVPDELSIHEEPAEREIERDDEKITTASDTEDVETSGKVVKQGGKRQRGDPKHFCHVCGKGFSIQKYLDSHFTNKHPEKCEINSLVLHQDGTS